MILRFTPEGITMWIKLLLVTEAAIGVAFIIKGELTNRRRGYDYENGRAFFVAGLAALLMFVSSSIVWLAAQPS
jgi:hypothetical protein